MPFQSKAQERAAFAGYLGPEMQAKAPQWAHETGQGGSSSHPKGSTTSQRNFSKLPGHVDDSKRSKRLQAIRRRIK